MKAERMRFKRKTMKWSKKKTRVTKAQMHNNKRFYWQIQRYLWKDIKQSLTESDKQINAQITAYKAQQQEIENMITRSIVQSTRYLMQLGNDLAYFKVWLYSTSPFGNRMHQFKVLLKRIMVLTLVVLMELQHLQQQMVL